MSGALHLPRTILHAVQTHAHDAAPDECVGLLFGHEAQVTRSVELTNRAPTPRTRFFADPQELVYALSGADARGETLLAVYHSHPDGAAFPSATDVAAARYDTALLIVTPTEVRAFGLGGQHIWELKLVITPQTVWFGQAPNLLEPE